MLLYICITIIFISILFSIYSYKENKLSLLLSAYLIILATYGMAHHYTTFEKSDFWLAIFFNHFTPLWVMAGPLVYLYVKSTLEDAPRLPKYAWIHFIPSLLFLISASPYYLKPFSEKLELARQIHADLEFLKMVSPNLILTPEINFILRPTLLFTYALASLALLIQFQKKERQHLYIPSQQIKITLRWLFTLITISLGLAISFLIVSSKFIFTPSIGYELLSHPLHLVSGILFLIMTISPFFFPQILYGLPNYQKEIINPSKETSTIKSEAEIPTDENDPFVQLSHKIQEYLKNEKPYLDKEFSMHDIAVAMDVPNHHISYCLNQILQTNFANLKNRLRVEYSMNLLKQNETSTLSIEGIAQNSGFATRSSFYSAFKNVTGTTPTEFLQKEKSLQQ